MRRRVKGKEAMEGREGVVEVEGGRGGREGSELFSGQFVTCIK